MNDCEPHNFFIDVLLNVAYVKLYEQSYSKDEYFLKTPFYHFILYLAYIITTKTTHFISE